MMTEKETNFLNALRRFEDAAFALLDAWVETGAGAYPFPDSFAEVCANLTTFRARSGSGFRPRVPPY